MSLKRLIVAVESAATFAARRTLCRQGWMKLFASKHLNVEAFFVVGNNGREPHCNGDIIYVPANDDYEGLPQKTQQLFEYFLRTHQFEYLYKCDDDTFVHLDRLMSRLNQDQYVGRVNTWERDGKSSYAEGGAGYILSRRAVELALDKFVFREDLKGAEDVFVALALRDAGIRPVQDDRFSQWPTPCPTKTNDQITCHYIREQAQVDEILAGLNLSAG